MDLHLTSEQMLLRDSAAKFIGAAGPKVARGFREQELSFAPVRLREAGALGWLSILVPGSANGLGLGLTELALVLEQAGRGDEARSCTGQTPSKGDSADESVTRNR